MSDKTGVKMNDSKDKFLQRMFWYRLQYPVAFVVALLLSCGQLFFIWQGKYPQIEWGLPSAFVLFVALFNTVTYLYSKFLVKKYGVEMFADLDKESLLKHREFDSKSFGEYFASLNRYNKISGMYMLAVIMPAAFINLYLATAVGAIYFIGYYTYRITHSDAISYKVPNVFTGWRRRRFPDHLRGNYAEAR